MTALSLRVAKAKAAAKFAAIVTRDRDNKPATLVVPGTSGKRYQQILRRSKRVITSECRLETGSGYVNCKGNSNGHVCYHSIAATIAVAQDAGCSVSFCSSEQDADRLAHMGGSVAQLGSRQSGARICIVIYHG